MRWRIVTYPTSEPDIDLRVERFNTLLPLVKLPHPLLDRVLATARLDLALRPEVLSINAETTEGTGDLTSTTDVEIAKVVHPSECLREVHETKFLGKTALDERSDELRRERARLAWEVGDFRHQVGSED